MYKRVEAQMVLLGISRRELANRLGISYNTINQKLSGKSDFSFDEAAEVRRILNAPEQLEDLFERVNPTLKVESNNVVHRDESSIAEKSQNFEMECIL